MGRVGFWIESLCGGFDGRFMEFLGEGRIK